MLVCSCNYITDKEIKAVITEMLDEDCWQLIVPGKVYHAMGKRGRCCGCFPNVVDIIIRTTEEIDEEDRNRQRMDIIREFIESKSSKSELN